MKKILFFILCACLLSSCATVSRFTRSINGPAAQNGDQAARNRIAATNIRSYSDKNTGAVVYKSMYNDYCFSAAFGTIKLENTKYEYIQVYSYDPKVSEEWMPSGEVHRNGPFTDIQTWTNGRPQIISFAAGSQGAVFVTVFGANIKNGVWKKGARLASYTF